MDTADDILIEESDEEDYENYFLQPASSPYNIADKVKEANTALFKEDGSFDDKNSRVKFKEKLIDYEPEYSEEETSIESDENIDYSLMEEDTTILETQLQTSLILNVCNTDDEEDEIGEIIEDIEPDSLSISDHHTVNFDVQCQNMVLTHKQINEIKSELTTNTEELNKEEKPKYTAIKNKFNNINVSNNNKLKVEDISCKRHCIDSIDRLDFNSNISVCKINAREQSYIKCPRLKLQRRNCCEKNEMKIQQKLPCYTGLRSEYGLTAAQLERRERLNEILKMRKLERQRLIEENKRRKYQQNEHVFCEWLKAVSTRKIHTQQKHQRDKQPLSSTIITFPVSKCSDGGRGRPKTANEILPKRNVRKMRPHTSSTCIFIEVPSNVLQKGINIGDLLVAKSQVASKKLHVFTTS